MAICPTEGDLKNFMDYVECQVRREGEKTRDNGVGREGHVDVEEVIRLGVNA